MNATLGWIQLALYLGLLLLITKPLGLYLLQVLDANAVAPGSIRSWAAGTPHLSPRRSRSRKEQHWKQYTISMLIFSLFTMLVTYAILRLQAILPLQHLLNPQGFQAWRPPRL
jgi:K+-transporting ATPase ATPase A chain